MALLGGAMMGLQDVLQAMFLYCGLSRYDWCQLIFYMVFNTQLLVQSAIGAYQMSQRAFNLPLGLDVGLTIFYGISLYYAYRTYSEFKAMVQPGGGGSAYGGGEGSRGAQYSALPTTDQEAAPKHTAFAGAGTRLGTDVEKDQSTLESNRM